MKTDWLQLREFRPHDKLKTVPKRAENTNRMIAVKLKTAPNRPIEWAQCHTRNSDSRFAPNGYLVDLIMASD